MSTLFSQRRITCGRREVDSVVSWLHDLKQRQSVRDKHSFSLPLKDDQLFFKCAYILPQWERADIAKGRECGCGGLGEEKMASRQMAKVHFLSKE